MPYIDLIEAMKEAEHDTVLAARLCAVAKDQRIGEYFRCSEVSTAIVLQRQEDLTGSNDTAKTGLASAMRKLEFAVGPLLGHRGDALTSVTTTKVRHPATAITS